MGNSFYSKIYLFSLKKKQNRDFWKLRNPQCSQRQKKISEINVGITVFQDFFVSSTYIYWHYLFTSRGKKFREINSTIFLFLLEHCEPRHPCHCWFSYSWSNSGIGRANIFWNSGKSQNQRSVSLAKCYSKWQLWHAMWR